MLYKNVVKVDLESNLYSENILISDKNKKNNTFKPMYEAII